MNNRNLSIILLLAIGMMRTTYSQMISEENSYSMLCVGSYWTQDEGKASLNKMQQSCSKCMEWEKRAEKVQAQLLKGSWLVKRPKMAPLNPILEEVRHYYGYTLQNISFESLVGVYVTETLYRPTDKQGNILSSIKANGHGTIPDKIERYHPQSQRTFVSLARMGAIVWAYDKVAFGKHL